LYRTVLATLGAEPSHADAEIVEWEDWEIMPSDREHPVSRGLHVGFRGPHAGGGARVLAGLSMVPAAPLRRAASCAREVQPRIRVRTRCRVATAGRRVGERHVVDDPAVFAEQCQAGPQKPHRLLAAALSTLELVKGRQPARGLRRVLTLGFCTQSAKKPAEAGFPSRPSPEILALGGVLLRSG
jgi:hypothetical protein